MRDYRRDILEHLTTELKELDWVELPENTRDLTGSFSRLDPYIQYPEYLQTDLGNGYQLVLGFGDTSPDMWEGVLYWSIQKDNETSPVYYQGEANNGSPRYVLWTLFEDLEEQLKKEAN